MASFGHVTGGSSFGRRLPLDGVTIIDMTTSYAGPTATMYLADMGAEVVKIERPGRGDDCRAWGPPFVDDWSAWYVSANRGKQSVCIDVSGADGRAILDDLLSTADAFIISLNPAKLSKLGLDPEAVRQRHPHLVYCAISGFGLDGPDSGLSGYDLIAQARSGLMSVTGEADGTPQRVSTALSDVATGITAAFTVASALAGRRNGAEGATIDVSLLDVGLALMAPRLAAYMAGEAEPSPSGATDSVLAIYQTFDGTDRPFVVAVGNDVMWQRLCEVVGLPDMGSDDRYSSNEKRREHRREIVELLQAEFRRKPADEWVRALMGAGVPASLINFLSDVVADDHLAARSAIVPMAGSWQSPMSVVHHPWRLVDGPQKDPEPPAGLGADTVPVLEKLGYADDVIDGWRGKGVVWSPEPQ